MQSRMSRADTAALVALPAGTAGPAPPLSIWLCDVRDYVNRYAPAGCNREPPTVSTGLTTSNVDTSGVAPGWTVSTDNIVVTGHDFDRVIVHSGGALAWGVEPR